MGAVADGTSPGVGVHEAVTDHGDRRGDLDAGDLPRLATRPWWSAWIPCRNSSCTAPVARLAAGFVRAAARTRMSTRGPESAETVAHGAELRGPGGVGQHHETPWPRPASGQQRQRAARNRGLQTEADRAPLGFLRRRFPGRLALPGTPSPLSSLPSDRQRVHLVYNVSQIASLRGLARKKPTMSSGPRRAGSADHQPAHGYELKGSSEQAVGDEWAGPNTGPSTK